MFTGMLEAVADVHQLTFILGHEMAHALLGHSVSVKPSADCLCDSGLILQCTVIFHTFPYFYIFTMMSRSLLYYISLFFFLTLHVSLKVMGEMRD